MEWTNVVVAMAWAGFLLYMIADKMSAKRHHQIATWLTSPWFTSPWFKLFKGKSISLHI